MSSVAVRSNGVAATMLLPIIHQLFSCFREKQVIDFMVTIAIGTWVGTEEFRRLRSCVCVCEREKREREGV